MKFFISFILSIALTNAFAQDCNLLVSSGGGFAGTETVYRVNADGSVLRGKGLGNISFTEKSKIKKSVAKKYFKKVDKALRSLEEFSHPGNMYHSISMTNGDKVRKITWGDAAFPLPENIRKIHEELSRILTQLTFSEYKPSK